MKLLSTIKTILHFFKERFEISESLSILTEVFLSSYMQKEYVPPRSPVLFRFVKTLWILVTSVFFIYALLAYFTDGKMIP